MVGGTFVAAISVWWAVRAHHSGDVSVVDTFRPAIRLGLVALFVGGLVVAISGDTQAKLMFQQQPMKMAAAEALCDTETGAGFSVFAIGDVENRCDVRQLTIPGLTSWLATGDFNATIKGVNDLQAEYEQKYGPGNYKPLIPVTYWSFRLMIGFGALSAVLGLWALWVTRKGRVPTSRRWALVALWCIPAPFLANSFGWIFTEMGRQPWVVAPNPTGRRRRPDAHPRRGLAGLGRHRVDLADQLHAAVRRAGRGVVRPDASLRPRGAAGGEPAAAADAGRRPPPVLRLLRIGAPWS